MTFSWQKNGLIRDAVDAGEVQLGLINHYYWYKKAAEVGEDAMNVQLAFAGPETPGLGQLVRAYIVRPTDNADGAGALMEWLLPNRRSGGLSRRHSNTRWSPVSKAPTVCLPCRRCRGPISSWPNWKTSPARCSCCRTSV